MEFWAAVQFFGAALVIVAVVWGFLEFFMYLVDRKYHA